MRQLLAEALLKARSQLILWQADYFLRTNN